MLAAVLSSAAAAQRPGIGTFGRGRVPGKLTIDPGIDVPKPVNAVNLLVENRAAMALTDSQFMRVITIKRELDSANAPLARRIDSVQRLFKGGPVFSEPSKLRRDSVAAGHSLVRELTANIESHIADSKEQAYGLLSAPQLAKAEQIEEKARKAGATPARGRI